MQSFQRARPAISAFLLMMSVAAVSSASSFFVRPVSDELGIGRAAFTLYYSLLIASGTLASPFVGRAAGKFGILPVLLFSGGWCAVGFWALAQATTLPAFYIAGTLMGIWCSSTTGCCTSMIVHQNYTRKTSSLMGVVMAGSGVGGVLLSSILPAWIADKGWRSGFQFLGWYWLILLCGAALALGKCGRAQPLDEPDAQSPADQNAVAYGKKALLLLFTTGIVLALTHGFLQHLPAYLEKSGFDAIEVGRMMAIYTAALAAGKFSQGFLYERLGLKIGSLLMFGIYGCGFLLLLFASSGILFIYLAVPLLAVGMGVASVLLPLTTGNLFSKREYAVVWGIVSGSASAGNVLGTPLYGLSYDLTGSYFLSILISPFILAAALLAQFSTLRLSPCKKSNTNA